MKENTFHYNYSFTVSEHKQSKKKKIINYSTFCETLKGAGRLLVTPNGVPMM